MDDKWFKQQQKKAGVTADQIAARLGRHPSVVSKILNAKQNMTLDWAKAFADSLNQPLATILEKAGVTDEASARQIIPGFAESDVAPFISQGAEQRGTVTIAEAFGAKPGIDIWRVKGDAMALAGYREGDFILVDTFQAERAKAGDVVIAQIYDRQGSATTVLRQFQPPVLVCPKDLSVHVVDNNNVVIMGKVTASWRTN
ncbi:LexA family protein [Pseudogemmobacter bohemicus]|uniref:LexA family protein n=1 Tax=Pseudogemmobacter bohemicus TaxID=2250708 RepID=UPI000DD40732|nr:XRE family transcriptional regulator [Pseudogemmobacter bohemicus]